VLLFRIQFRAVALTCVFLGAFTALAVFVLPGNVWNTWFTDALPAGGYANGRIHAGFFANQSINAFVMRLLLENYFSKAPLLYPSLAKPVATVLALIVASVTVFSSFRLRRPSNHESEDDEIAAFLLMIYLVAPISWDHHLVYILPAALLAISLLASGSVGGKTAVLVAAALALIAWKLPIGSPAITSGWRTLLISGKLYGALVLWLFFIGRLRRSALTVIPA
jgi:Glycosyltransferase family 87